jgi:pimeloyl-ACP methyl ester carboxylesterase
MVHGLATSLAFWYAPYAVEFSRRFRVTLFDLRGHGRSEMPPTGYTAQVLARDLSALMDALGIERAHLIAHSFGGVIAMNFACEEAGRVCSLVLADSQISAVRQMATRLEWPFGRRIQPVLDRHGVDLDTRVPFFGYRLLTRVAQWQLHGEPVPPELLELVAPLMGRRGTRAAAQWLKLMETGNAERELMGDDGLSLDRLHALSFPILAMYGDNSQARLTGEGLLAVWPHGEFRRVRDAGHFFPTSRPDEVMSGCRRFWDGEFAPERRGHRTGEERRSWFRSDRVFYSGNQWFYATREDGRVGPFQSAADAYHALASFLMSVKR